MEEEADNTGNDKKNASSGLCKRMIVKEEGEAQETYAAIEMLAADMGLTSFTSRAFCRASFLLAASSCSSSSFRQVGRILRDAAACIALA